MLGEVTLANPNDEAEFIDGNGDCFVTVIDKYGEASSARIRQLEPIHETPIPETHRSLNTLADEIRELNISKGWETPGEEPNIDQMLMLIVGELSEAQEELRDSRAVHDVYFRNSRGEEVLDGKLGYVDEWGKPLKIEGFGIEVADALIRLLHLCARLDLDIDSLVRDKMAFNRTRSFRHGGKAF